MNGQKAHVQGLELVFQRQLNFLPSFLSGFGLYTNYTYIESEALFPPSEIDGSERKASLPGQAKHVGNFGLSYEKYGFSGRLVANYHGKYLSEVSDSAANDIWFDDHIQLDLSLSQRIARHMRVFADLVNLNGEPLRAYQGVSDRPIQREYYSWWGTFGIKLDF
jgi:TonB-dependent receptor